MSEAFVFVAISICFAGWGASLVLAREVAQR